MTQSCTVYEDKVSFNFIGKFNRSMSLHLQFLMGMFTHCLFMHSWNVSWTSNQYIRMISEGSCDTAVMMLKIYLESQE